MGNPSTVAYFNTPVFQPPSLLNPGSGVTIMSLNPTFSWEPGTPAPKYRILLGTTPQLIAPFWEHITTLTTVTYPATAIPLQYMTTYYWRVRALDEEDNFLGNPSSTRNFITPVGSPTLVYPVNESVPNLIPDFLWNALGSATSYTITVATDEGLNDVLWQETVSETQAAYAGTALNYGATYYWGLSALLDGQPYGNPSQVKYFATPNLTAPDLLSPIGGITVSDLTPVFSWTNLEGAVSYLLKLSLSDDFTSPYASVSVVGTSVEYTDTPELDWDTDFFWQITGLDGDGAQVGLVSTTGTFHTPVYVAVDLITPIGEVSSSRPQFSWSELTNAAGYHLQVASDNSFASILWDAQVSATSVTYGADEPLTFGEEYSWRVRGVDADGNEFGQWSAVGSFNLVTTGIVSLISPVNTDVYTLTPVFSWAALQGAAKYGVMVYSDAELNNLIWSTMQVTGTSVTYPSQGVTPLQFGNTYWWQTVAMEANGNPLGDPSPPVTFTVSTAMIPELIYPVGVEVEILTPTFSWSPIDGVSRFKISVSTNQTFTQVIWSNDNVVGTSITYPSSGVTPLEYSQDYWWRVTSMTPEGQILSDPSVIAQFTTPSGEMILELQFGGP